MKRKDGFLLAGILTQCQPRYWQHFKFIFCFILIHILPKQFIHEGSIKIINIGAGVKFVSNG